MRMENDEARRAEAGKRSRQAWALRLMTPEIVDLAGKRWSGSAHLPGAVAAGCWLLTAGDYLPCHWALQARSS